MLDTKLFHKYKYEAYLFIYEVFYMLKGFAFIVAVDKCKPFEAKISYVIYSAINQRRRSFFMHKLF